MRTATVTIVCLLLVCACGGDDKAANKKKIEQLKKQYRALSQELADLINSHTDIKTSSFKATAAFRAAKKSGDEERISEAKMALEDAQEAAKIAVAAEKALTDRRTALRDKIKALGGDV